MNINYSLLILTLKLFLICNTESVQTKSISEADIRVDFQNGGEVIQLEAFKYHGNDLILKEKNIQSYQKLKWYSIGNPLLVKLKSNDSESIFQFNRRGFYARIEMLTDIHKQLLIEEVKRVYNVTVGLNQIDQLILSSFNCEIHVHKGHNSNEEDLLITVYLFTIIILYFLKFFLTRVKLDCLLIFHFVWILKLQSVPKKEIGSTLVDPKVKIIFS